nr:hypothetical protein 2 [Bacillales bacterium]
MRLAEDARDHIERKKAGFYALLDNWANNLEGYAKQHASWVDRTGHARQGIHGGVERSKNQFHLFLSHGVEYGRFLEEGTPPHEIRPKNKKALYCPGAKHPVKKVNHPGSKAHPIIGPTIDTHLPRIRKTVKEYWRS